MGMGSGTKTSKKSFNHLIIAVNHFALSIVPAGVLCDSVVYMPNDLRACLQSVHALPLVHKYLCMEIGLVSKWCAYTSIVYKTRIYKPPLCSCLCKYIDTNNTSIQI